MFGIMKGVVKLIEKSKKTKTINIQYESMDKQIKNAELLHPTGFFSMPTTNSKTLIIQVTKNYSVATHFSDYNRDTLILKEGERCIYSTDKNGNIKTKIFLLDNGTVKIEADKIEINGNTKSLVTHKELNTALQKLMTALKAHTHPTPSGTSLVSVDLSTAVLDISSSETKTIKTGG